MRPAIAGSESLTLPTNPRGGESMTRRRPVTTSSTMLRHTRSMRWWIQLAWFSSACVIAACSTGPAERSAAPDGGGSSLESFCAAAAAVTEQADPRTLEALRNASEAFLYDAAVETYTSATYGQVTDDPAVRGILESLGSGEPAELGNNFQIGNYDSMTLQELDTVAVPNWTRWALDDAEPNGLGGIEPDAVVRGRIDSLCDLEGRTPAPLPACGKDAAEPPYCSQR